MFWGFFVAAAAAQKKKKKYQKPHVWLHSGPVCFSVYVIKIL